MCSRGTLPAVSYYIGALICSGLVLVNLSQIYLHTGPAELSEHPPYRPIDGAWLQREVVNAIVNSPKYNKTILIISFDETGGWGDQYVYAFCDPTWQY